MSLLTTITLRLPFSCHEDVEHIKDISRWLHERKLEGYTIISTTTLETIEDETSPMRVAFRGTYRFVDAGLALLFKLSWA